MPEVHNEVCSEIASIIATNLGVNIKSTNAFCLPSKVADKPRKLSVYLSSIEEKLSFIDRVKKQKLTVNNIDKNWGKTAIFVNVQMIPVYRDLFFKARKAVKEVGYKFIWFKNNKIFVRRNESSKAIIIADELSISKIK